MSLRFRINLIITVLIVLFSLVTAKIVLDDMRSSIREEMEAGTKVTLQLLSTVLYSSQFAPPIGNEPNRRPAAVPAAASGACARTRSACTRDDGSLVYTSPPPVYKAGRAAPQLVLAPGGAAPARDRS